MSKVNTAKIANLSMVKQVECAVCMDVYTDPVVTECGHTFCRHCISLCMDSNPVCPQCRKGFITRKLTVNFSIKSIIETGLEFRCDYDWNGCKELLSLDQLPGHHRECRFRYCGKCRANVSRTGGDHKCKGLLKPAVNTNVNSVNTDQDHKGEGQSTVVGNHSKSETTGARKHIPRRCRYWPTCRKGDQCNFHHPDQCCFQYAKSGSCRFGKDCKYIHPICEAGLKCSKRGCVLTHAEGTVAQKIAEDMEVQKAKPKPINERKGNRRPNNRIHTKSTAIQPKVDTTATSNVVTGPGSSGTASASVTPGPSVAQSNANDNDSDVELQLALEMSLRDSLSGNGRVNLTQPSVGAQSTARTRPVPVPRASDPAVFKCAYSRYGCPNTFIVSLARADHMEICQYNPANKPRVAGTPRLSALPVRDSNPRSPIERVLCEYAWNGCNERLYRDEMTRHMTRCLYKPPTYANHPILGRVPVKPKKTDKNCVLS